MIETLSILVIGMVLGFFLGYVYEFKLDDNKD